MSGAGSQLMTKGASARSRALLDANLHLSYLLSQAGPNRTIVRLIRLASTGAFRLVLPEEVIDAVIQIVRTKPYFRQRMTEQEARSAMAELRQWADVPPRLTDVPRIVRDPADDYLVAHAFRGRVDVLVTGDRDLLALDGKVDPLRVVTAAVFLQMLEPDADNT